MPSGLPPLCPSCFDRTLSWTAASCPSCSKSSPIARCDACTQSRAGAFVPDDPKHPAQGGAQRFLCADCMERLLEEDVSDQMRNAIVAVLVAVVAVRFTNVAPGFIYALFAAALACFVAWWWSTARRRSPSRRTAGIWNYFRRRIDKAVAKRARALK